MIYFLIVLIILILVFIISLLYEEKDKNVENRTIDKDGYKVFNNIKKEDVLTYLPNNYVFINYKFEIIGCSLSTFHRDVTSSQYIHKTKYPVYTYIVYFNKGELLSVSPNSHKTVPFLYNKILNISGDINTSVLFNCDLIHSGAINTFGKERHAIQYKLCHKEDLYKLKHLFNINKTTNSNCNINNLYIFICRKISLLFPYVFNHMFTNLLQSKQSDDSILQTFINKYYIGDFYNN